MFDKRFMETFVYLVGIQGKLGFIPFVWDAKKLKMGVEKKDLILAWIHTAHLYVYTLYLGTKYFYGAQEFLYNAEYLNSTLLVLFGLMYFTITMSLISILVHRFEIAWIFNQVFRQYFKIVRKFAACV